MLYRLQYALLVSSICFGDEKFHREIKWTLPFLSKIAKNHHIFSIFVKHMAPKFFLERKCRKFNRTHDKSGQDKLTDPAVGYQVDYSRYRG